MPAQTDPIKAAQAMSLAELGYQQSQIARELRLPHSTVRGIIKGCGSWGKIAAGPVFANFRQDQNKHLESAYRSFAARLLQHAEENLDKMQPYQAVVAAGICTDKAQLLGGLPTEISANLHVHQVEALESLADKLKGFKSDSNLPPPSQVVDITE